jgi:hypothetical protein
MPLSKSLINLKTNTSIEALRLITKDLYPNYWTNNVTAISVKQMLKYLEDKKEKYFIDS